MFKPEDITVYVPFFNASSTIQKLLEGLAAQTIKPRSLIIIDDGSNEPFSITKTNHLDFDVRIIRHEKNSGLSAARNTALSAVSTPLVASLDSDVMPDSQWLEKLLSALNNNPVEGVGGKLLEYFSDDIGDRWRAVHMCQHWGDKSILNPRFLYGANNLFKADILRKCGGYIKELRTNYEDMSLSENIYSKGLNLFYEPSALCYHLRRDSEISILPGFWKWFHAKGLLKGDFKSPEGLLSRIDNVNFGIYKYRYGQDLANNSQEFLKLDSLIPWVFCALDLQFASNTYGLSVPAFPDDSSFMLLPEDMGNLMMRIIKSKTIPHSSENWHREYISKFRKCLDDYEWQKSTLSNP